jgi:two-component system, NtrC family, sensor histidine kinase HydH
VTEKPAGRARKPWHFYTSSCQGAIFKRENERTHHSSQQQDRVVVSLALFLLTQVGAENHCVDPATEIVPRTRGLVPGEEAGLNPKIMLRVTAPAVIVGVLLLAACLVSIGYISRLQTNLTNILSQNVASLQAAQELEIRVRQLRHHNLLYLMDPNPADLDVIDTDQQRFKEGLEAARRASNTDEERSWVRAIEDGYKQYEQEQAALRANAMPNRPAADYRKLADSHPIRHVVDPCEELVRVNKEQMEATARESLRVSNQASWAMVLLGLAGPVGGLIAGYGMARGLSKSVYRLGVRVRDMAQHLDRDVASVRVAANDDLQTLDRQMQTLIQRVEEVTESVQQHQRELLRADQLAALGQLGASVAHEIRNPLTGIKMLVEAALRPRNPTPLNAEDLRVIHREVTRLEQTVQGFLDFARLPTPRLGLCDLREAVAQARDLIRARAEQQRVEVVVHVPEHSVVGFVDRGQLGTVLVNLFLNALDAMPKGGRLEADLETTDGGGVRLTVRDTGGGIPPEIAARLFTPFATTKPTGTGLGLSLSRRIMKEHGGDVTASNRPEGGASFFVTLPPAPPGDRNGDLVSHR